MHKGAQALLWGELPAAWGEPACPGFPLKGKRKRGNTIPRCRRLVLPPKKLDFHHEC